MTWALYGHGPSVEDGHGDQSPPEDPVYLVRQQVEVVKVSGMAAVVPKGDSRGGTVVVIIAAAPAGGVICIPDLSFASNNNSGGHELG